MACMDVVNITMYNGCAYLKLNRYLDRLANMPTWFGSWMFWQLYEIMI